MTFPDWFRRHGNGAASAYLILWLIAALSISAIAHSDFVLKPGLMASAAPAFLALGIHGVVTGKFSGRVGTIRRKSEPIFYWLGVVVLTSLGAFLLGWAAVALVSK
jgi:hypothetical protein